MVATKHNWVRLSRKQYAGTKYSDYNYVYFNGKGLIIVLCKVSIQDADGTIRGFMVAKINMRRSFDFVEGQSGRQSLEETKAFAEAL